MSRPRICIDTDALVNLLALGCLREALWCVGCTEDMCSRLPSVPAQVRRARWVGERWPNADRALMAEAAERLPSLPPPSNLELQSALNNIKGVDEGEAYLLAKAVEESDLLLLSGDGRMIRALYEVDEKYGVRDALQGRVLIFPQIIGGLVKALSVTEVEYRWRSSSPSSTDKKQKSLSVMFGSASPIREADFWQGYELQMSHVTDVCGASWLYSL